MDYGDFIGLVQLGVGLHAGTALLQLYGEIGGQRLVRRFERLESLVDRKDGNWTKVIEEMDDIKGRYNLFRVKFFNDYRRFVIYNSVVAAILAVWLVILTLCYEVEISWVLAALSIVVSVLPAPATLLILIWKAENELRPLDKEVEKLLETALKSL